MPGEPPRVQPSKKVAEHWDEDGNWIGGGRRPGREAARLANQAGLLLGRLKPPGDRRRPIKIRVTSEPPGSGGPPRVVTH